MIRTGYDQAVDGMLWTLGALTALATFALPIALLAAGAIRTWRRTLRWNTGWRWRARRAARRGRLT